MRIGIYASMIASEKGHERNVSAHAQIPLQAAAMFQQAGHDVHLITNEFGEQHTLPHCFPDGVELHLVPDARKRPKQMRGAGGRDGIKPLAMVKQLLAIRHIIKSEQLDRVFFFGYTRTGALGGMMRLAGIRVPITGVLLGGSTPYPNRPLRWLLRRVDGIITATQCAAEQYRRFHGSVQVVRHGVVRDLLAELEPDARRPAAHRVLFWRDPTPDNGADLCIHAFRELAPSFADVTFTFAIRPATTEDPGIQELDAANENVEVHRFPYREGVSLAGLMAESLLVVLPFRRLTVDPQLSIAESLAAGVPVIGSDVRSIPELIEDGVTGAIVPSGDAAALTEALRQLLENREKLDQMRSQTARRFSEAWNWDRYVDGLMNT